jgi:nucleoside-diphosphate-sugar epimerase
MQSKTIAVWGAFGTIGRSVVDALKSDPSIRLRVVGRSASKLAEAFPDPSIEKCPVDLTTQSGCEAAAGGADAVVYTLGLPYTAKDFAQYPAMMTRAVSAMKGAGTRKLLHISNVYPFGRPEDGKLVSGRVNEDHPRNPCSVKGRFRKEQEDVVLAAHSTSGLATTLLRLPDFYGPHAEMSLAHQIFDAAARGKAADLFAPIDTPHEFVFTPDVGPVVARLLATPAAFGTDYNLAGAGSITVEAFAKAVYEGFGVPLKKRAIGSFGLRALGIFVPVLREFVEMSYLQSTPILLDDRKLVAAVGPLAKTSYLDGIAKTVAAMKGRAGTFSDPARRPETNASI